MHFLSNSVSTDIHIYVYVYVYMFVCMMYHAHILRSSPCDVETRSQVGTTCSCCFSVSVSPPLKVVVAFGDTAPESPGDRSRESPTSDAEQVL